MSLMALLFVAFGIYGQHADEAQGVDINFPGLLRRYWLDILIPFLEAFIVLSGARFLFLFIRYRRSCAAG